MSGQQIGPLGTPGFLGLPQVDWKHMLLPACLFLLLGDILPFSNPWSGAGVEFPGRNLCVPGTRWVSLASPHPSLTTLTLG